MIKPLMVYIYAYQYLNMSGYLRRFIDTYRKFPAGRDHKLLVVINGGYAYDQDLALINELDCDVVECDNLAFDTGAYRDIAASDYGKTEAMFCCGATTHFMKAGWLDRICHVWDQLGPNLYGAIGSHEQRPHIRTATGFLLSPFFLTSYPHPSIDTERYNFEHGEESLTWWATILKHKALMVTWDGVYEQHQWPMVKGGFREGSQYNLLCYDKHCDRHGYG